MSRSKHWRPEAGIVLAAGLGSRMRPLTDQVPKPLVRLKGRALIDHVLDRLATAGIIRGFDVDTSHFTGNYPPACRIEACAAEGDPGEGTAWTEIPPSSTSTIWPTRSRSTCVNARARKS